MTDEIEQGLANTTESWKRALLISARDAARREAWIIGLAAATFAVAVASLVVALVK